MDAPTLRVPRASDGCPLELKQSVVVERATMLRYATATRWGNGDRGRSARIHCIGSKTSGSTKQSFVRSSPRLRPRV